MKGNFILILILLVSCKNKKEDIYINNGEIEKSVRIFEDGRYCAEISYYNPNTGNNSYTLDVEVENDFLTKIYWNNGGWIDNSNFLPQSISSGNCIVTTNAGYKYEIILGSKGGGCNSYIEDESKYNGDIGYVVWESYSCDYIVIESRGWYIVAEKMYGAISLSEGDKIQGEGFLSRFGYKNVYCINRDKEMSLYIDNYYASLSSALEKISEKCN